MDGSIRVRLVAAALAATIMSAAPGQTTGPAAAPGEQPAETPLDDRATAGVAELEETVITATRREEPVENVSGSVSVIDRPLLEAQSTVSSDLGDVLAKTVPGFSPSTETLSDFGFTLRGRDFLVLVDGVPQSTPLRNVQRALRVISPDAIERIEVIRGATAVYGFGATGGLVNIITRKPGDEEGVSGWSEVGARFSTEHFSDSFELFTTHGVTLREGDFDALVVGTYADRDSFFDADGDRIPPDPQAQGGLADTREYDVLAKFGWDFTPNQRIEFSVNHFDIEQDTNYITVPGDVAAGDKATAARGDVPGKDPGTDDTVLNLVYIHDDVLGTGSRASVQVYYQDFRSRFTVSDFFVPPSQSFIESEKFGARLTIDTPFGLGLEDFGGLVTWGVDFQHDTTAQPLEDGRIFTPNMEQNAIAPFAQLKIPIGDRLVLNGGVRHEIIAVDVEDFTTVTTVVGGGTDVAGGDLNYDATLFNVGAIYDLTDAVALFGTFSQGFSVADVGRELRATAAPSVDALDPEAQKVDSYELGVRGKWKRVRSSVAGFYSESDLGTTFGGTEFTIQRQPERVWGAEGELDVHVTDKLDVGGSVTWIEGKIDPDDNGSYDERIDGIRIPPLKVTAHLEHRTLPGWTNRLQLLYSGKRDRFNSAEFGQGDIEDFLTFDLYSQIEVGPGHVLIGIENLLNEDYFPVISQASNLDSDYAMGRGRTVTLSYKMTW